VAKVDELMGLCDALEAQQQERELRKSVLVRSSLSRFAEAPTPENLGYLFHKSYDIPPSELRKSILTLAVQGKLVPQDPNDEPARHVVEKLAITRMQYTPAKHVKNTAKLCDADDNRYLYDIPSSWTWCRFGDLVLDFRYGTSRKCDRNSGGVPVLRIPNIQNGRVDSTDLKFTSMPSAEFAELRLQADDILLVRSNGSEALVGKSAVVCSEDERFAYAGYLVRARIPKKEVSSKYLHVALSTRVVRDQIEGPIRTTSGVKNINTKELSNLALPLPPLAEQHRIVAKVDQLMALVDELERQQAASRENATKLLDAIVHEMTSGV
jgi:type I restriction enzyme S subunit